MIRYLFSIYRACLKHLLVVLVKKIRSKINKTNSLCLLQPIQYNTRVCETAKESEQLFKHIFQRHFAILITTYLSKHDPITADGLFLKESMVGYISKHFDQTFYFCIKLFKKIPNTEWTSHTSSMGWIINKHFFLILISSNNWKTFQWPL